MANTQKFYFYSPTWDYPPGGPIKLGNVLTSIGMPQRPLICVPPGDSDAESDDVFSTRKTDAEYSKEKLRSGKFSVLTKFLSLLGFGVDFGAHVDCSNSETFSFETITTTQFIPSPTYLQKCAEASGVRRYLEQTRYRKPLYIITGVKVVMGVAASTERSRSTGVNLDVEVNGAMWTSGTIPIGSGPGVEHKVSSSTKTRWDGSDDFVFAYRVSRVSVSKKTHQIASEEEYQKGAMLGKESKRATHPALTVFELHDKDHEAEAFTIEQNSEDGEVILCAFPKESPST